MSNTTKTFAEAKSRWRKLTAEPAAQPSLWPGAILCFAVSLIVCLLQNLTRNSLEMARLFDSGHYLITCEQILNAWQQLSINASPEHLRQICQSLQANIMLDGPVLPTIGALVFLVLHKLPSALDMRTPIVLEAVFQAFSSAFVFIAASKFTAFRKWGFLAGITWACYPPAVIGAGKFLTEIPTTAFMLGLLLACNQLQQKPNLPFKNIWFWAFLSGSTAVLTIFSKPALQLGVLSVIALSLYCLKGYKQKLIAVCGLLPGVCALLLPWLMFTHLATGHLYFTPQRKPTGNLVIGSDLETDGWASLPTSPFVSLYGEDEPALPVAIGIYQSHLPELCNLTLRKIPRLWGNPWNDGRNKFWGASVLAQQWWHRLLWATALLGALLFAAANQVKRLQSERMRFIGYAAFLLLAGHLPYLAFVTISRYGFTAMPLVVILSVYGLSCAAACKQPIRQTLTLLSVAVTGILLFQSNWLPFLAMGSENFSGLLLANLTIKWLLMLLLLAISWVLVERSEAPESPAIQGKFAWGIILLGLSSIMIAFTTFSGELYEWACPLNSGSTAVRRIDLPKCVTNCPDKPDWAMVVFDGTGDKVSFNQTALSEKPAPLYLYNGGNLQAANFQLFAATLKQLPDNFRQWRAVNIPLNLLKDSTNTIAIAGNNSGKQTIFGSYPAINGNRERTLSFSTFSAGRLMDNFEQFESRLTDIMPLTASRSESSLLSRNRPVQNQDLSIAPGRQFGQYRMNLVLGYSRSPNSKNPTTAPTISGQIKGPLAIDPQAGFSKAERIPESLCGLSHLHICIKGYLRSPGQTTSVSAAAAVRRVSDLGDAFYIPGCPQILQVNNQWLPFKIEGSLPNSALAPGAKALQILMTPAKQKLELKDLNYEIRAQQSAEFRNHRLVVL